MIVEITQAAKETIYVAELEIVNKIIRELGVPEDGDHETEMRSLARFVVGDGADFVLLRGKAEIARNARAWEEFEAGTRDLDVWVEITVKALDPNYEDAYYEIGAYLSDIWSIGTIGEYALRKNMRVKEYREVKGK